MMNIVCFKKTSVDFSCILRLFFLFLCLKQNVKKPTPNTLRTKEHMPTSKRGRNLGHATLPRKCILDINVQLFNNTRSLHCNGVLTKKHYKPQGLTNLTHLQAYIIFVSSMTRQCFWHGST